MVAEVGAAEWAGTFVDDAFNDLQSVVIENVIEAITPYVAWLVALYLLGLFLFAITGKPEVLKDGLWTILKIAVVSAIALNITYLEQWLLAPINGLLSLLSNAVSDSDSSTLYSIADSSINKSVAVAEQAWQKAGDAGWRDWEIKASWFLAGIVAGIGGLAMVGPSVIVITAGKAIISLLFMVSPVFVLAAIFPITAKYFINWTAAVGNAVWFIILAALIMPLASLMTEGMMDKMDVSGGLAGPWLVIIMVIFVVILFWVLISFVFNMASTLAGGLSMSMPVTSSRIGRGTRNAAFAGAAAPFRGVAALGRMPFGRRGGSVARN